MPTWPLGSHEKDDEDVRRSENEGFGQEAELHAEEHQHDIRDDADVRDGDVRDADLQDVDAQDRYPENPENRDIPVASSPVETAEDYPAQETPVQDTRVDDTPAVDTPVQDTPAMTKPAEEGQSLLQPGFADTFQQRWREIQANFVDDPHETVREADQFADEVVNNLTTALTDRKHSLDERWQAEKENTEELRLAMRGYRELLDRLIRL
jgi:hypothetical protein